MAQFCGLEGSGDVVATLQRSYGIKASSETGALLPVLTFCVVNSETGFGVCGRVTHFALQPYEETYQQTGE